MKSTKYALIVACLALVLSACGSSGTGSPVGAGTTGQGAGGAGEAAPGGAGGPRGPGGSGQVAAVSGKTAQVQGQAGQVAVTWTAKTTFTQEVATKATALKVGDCVVAMPAPSGTGQPAEGSPVAAVTVRVTAPVAGSCTGGLRTRGPSGGAPPSGAQGTGQQGPGEGGPGSGGPGDGGPGSGGRGFALGAFGEVTAIAGSGFTVESTRPGATAKTSTEVTTSSATTWTTTQRATAKAVTVGVCVNSLGEADSTGAIAATSIAVSAPVNGECAAGFRGAPGGGRGGGQGGDQAAGPQDDQAGGQ